MRAIVATISLAAVLLFANTVYGQNFVEGIHYERLPQPVGVADPSKIEVVEVFSYACGACFAFEREMQAFKAAKAADVAVVQTHIAYSRDTETLAQVYYTARALGVIDTMHQKIFDAIHLDGKRMRDEDDYAEFFASNNLDKSLFKKTFNSFGIKGQVRRAKQLIEAYGVNSTPQVIVDGTYVLKRTEDNPDLLAVANFLVDKIRDERTDN